MMRNIQFKWTLTCLLLSLLTLLTLLPVGMAQNNDASSLPFLQQVTFLEAVTSTSTNVSSSSSSCFSVDSCKDCSNSYTCHWCEVDQLCHAKGSYHGCAFGSTCEKQPKPSPTPNDNSTCAAHSTCSECSLSSHLCHWCEYDNACHAVGSKYGCSTGVDCYSNDRCRRSEPESLVSTMVITRMSVGTLILVLLFSATLIGCASCCFWLVGGVKGAYDDLATNITMVAAASSSVPPSFIGGITYVGPSFMGPSSEPYSTNLDTHIEEEQQQQQQQQDEQEEAEEGNAAADEQANDDSQADNRGMLDEQEGDTTPVSSSMRQQQQQQQQQQPSHPDDLDHELTSPLLQSYHGDRSFQEPTQPTHARRLYRACATCYYVTVFVIVTLCLFSIYFFPTKPVYNVCSDAVAWKKIIANIAALKLNLGFEILISLSNPNHIHVALDKGSGNFSYNGKHVGTFQIPPIMAGAQAITDLMLIAHVTPDHAQALQLAEAYAMGKLVLVADFEATLRVPALNNYAFDFEKDGIVVNVNELQDRSLCACPTW